MSNVKKDAKFRNIMFVCQVVILNELNDMRIPVTLAIGMSPRSNALILFSICRNGAPSPCDSLSGSSSSSIGGAKSRRGVDTKSTPDRMRKICQISTTFCKAKTKSRLPGLATGGSGALIIGNEATRINGAFKSSPTSILLVEPFLFSFA